MGEQAAAGLKNGGVAQLGEHLPCKQGVKSSNLSVSIVKILNFHIRNISISAGIAIQNVSDKYSCSLKTEYRNFKKE